MRFTNIRNKDGKTLTTYETVIMAATLKDLLAALGFITDYDLINKRSFRLSLNRGSFRINTAMLGRNGRRDSRWQDTIKGYKFTDVPTWEQRKDYNHEVNRYLDELGISATVRNGLYTIRKGREAVTSWTPMDNSFDIEPASDLHEELDSDARIKAHRKAQYAERKAAAQARRPKVVRDAIREDLLSETV